MRVDVGGVGIEYEVTGEGRPVVLLHGFPDSGRLWRNQVPALADAGFKVIVPDLRGYGRSDKPPEVEKPKDGTWVVDFNKAYNPPCAFSAYTTCPLPPPQNWLKGEISAGEKYTGRKS